jgi:hypothetical protein
MPEKLKKIFEKEYGKKKGDIIFYSWENKRGIHYAKHKAMKGGKK